MSDETLDEMHERQAAATKEAGGAPEAEMQAAEVPWPKTPEELAAYIASLVTRPHDYGTTVYAISMAATAAFNYVAGTLGATGFQASCADLDVLRRTRGIKHGFMVIKAEDLLYPQYDVIGRTRKWIEKQPPELAPVAAELLRTNPVAHPGVIAHWKKLAEGSK